MFVVARLFATRLLVARLFMSDHDLPFAGTPVLFDEHLSPGAFIDAVNGFSTGFLK